MAWKEKKMEKTGRGGEGGGGNKCKVELNTSLLSVLDL